MIIKSLISGLSSLKENKRIIIVFYLANLIAGLIIMVPFRSLAGSLAGYSLLGKDLSRGLNMDFIIELITKYSSSLTTVSGLIFLMPVLYGLWTLFISGGAYGVFIHGKESGILSLWSYSAKYFGRIFRLFLWSIPILIIIYLTQFIFTGIKFIIWGSDPYQYINYWIGWVRFGWTYLAFIFYFIIFDYSRIILILNEENRTRSALWQGIKFFFKHPIRTVILALMVFCSSQIAFLVYMMVSPILNAPNTLIVIILLLVQQIYIFTRMSLRLTLYSSQVYMYKYIEQYEDTTALSEYQPVSQI